MEISVSWNTAACCMGDGMTELSLTWPKAIPEQRVPMVGHCAMLEYYSNTSYYYRSTRGPTDAFNSSCCDDDARDYFI